MASSQSPTQKRLIHAAFHLFTSQGFNQTPTKQIAELADVNEATLFRNFRSKHDLLLAVIQNAGVFVELRGSFEEAIAQTYSFADAVRHYARDCLNTLDPISELIRALVGEAGQYSAQNRQTLGQGLSQVTHAVAQYLVTCKQRDQVQLQVSPEKLAGVLNSVLLGYLLTDLSSESDDLWIDRDDFLDHLVRICLEGAALPPHPSLAEQPPPSEIQVRDLPADWVRTLFQQAKKQGPQPYAIVYVLFGAGLLPQELLDLERTHHFSSSQQHWVQINQGLSRQVPINQWILGKRYGSYSNNPLTQWLKRRHDTETALFLGDQGQALTKLELFKLWQDVVAELPIPEQVAPCMEQARQTWCVDMLMRGISPDDLSLLSGLTLDQLQPYIQRAKEKAALERAMQLDQSPS